MTEQSPPSHLEPPQKSVELEDSGAQGSVSNSDEEDHFSDATEGNEHSHSRTTSGDVSPIPRTRVEKVDDNPSHGEVPGTPAYEKRGRDSVPDEVEVIPEGTRSRSQSVAESQNHTPDPGESSVPRTVVERIEPERPSHGDVPGTFAYEQRRADAVPDVVTTAPESGGTSESSPESSDDGTIQATVPETLVSQVETPSDEEAEPAVHAHRRRPSDAVPDLTEMVPDAPDPQHSLDTSPEILAEEENQEVAGMHNGQQAPVDDDFDDFAEEQEGMGDDDFGDFDDGFQGPSEDVAEESTATPPPQSPGLPVPPLLDFDTIKSLSDLSLALDTPLDRLFPLSKDTTSLPPVEPIDNASAIFHTDRSISLWSQLVAPPPLQPQNWVKSRIRRLFLVSLGVPVDLDEILPASKQKKLVLPSIDLGSGQQLHGSSKIGSQDTSTADPSTTTSSPSTTQPHQPHQQQQQPPSSATESSSSYSRRRLPTPPPDLDLPAVHRLYATTDAALSNLTDPELHAHISELQQATQRASAVLDYWAKRLDGLVGEKEAFEGVIENLVSHARRVRK